jgi:putative oxidoreductase
MFLTFLDKYRNLGLLILRIGLGLMFIYHGVPKLMAGPEHWLKLGMSMGFLGIHFLPTFWGFMAAFAEAFGGLFLIGGFFFRIACFLLVVDMVVAATMHFGSHQGLAMASHAIEDGIVFLSLLLIGPGAISLDDWLWGRFGKKPK